MDLKRLRRQTVTFPINTAIPSTILNSFGSSRGGMSMQACLLLDVEPCLYRERRKKTLCARSLTPRSVSYFSDVRMNTEHALPSMGDSRGDHYKSSDEANACGWLRYLFRTRRRGLPPYWSSCAAGEWLRPGQRCSLERTATYFGPASCQLWPVQKMKSLPSSMALVAIRRGKSVLRFRETEWAACPKQVTVNGQPWTDLNGEWVRLPGNIGKSNDLRPIRCRIINSTLRSSCSSCVASSKDQPGFSLQQPHVLQPLPAAFSW